MLNLDKATFGTYDGKVTRAYNSRIEEKYKTFLETQKNAGKLEEFDRITWCQYNSTTKKWEKRTSDGSAWEEDSDQPKL